MATIGFRGALPSPDDATSIVCGSKAIGIGACEDCSALDRLECLENLQKISSLLFIFSTQSREPSHPLRVSASWYFLSFARVQEEGATLFPGTVVPPQLFGEPGESTTEANRATNGKTANLLVLPSLSFFRQGCGGELMGVASPERASVPAPPKSSFSLAISCLLAKGMEAKAPWPEGLPIRVGKAVRPLQGLLVDLFLLV